MWVAFWTKTLHYLEQLVAQMLMRCGSLPVMIPAVDAQSVVQREELNLGHYAQALNALVLQGGNDVAPETYGQTPMHAAWAGNGNEHKLHRRDIVPGTFFRRCTQLAFTALETVSTNRQSEI